jgi:HNH endonuclease
MAKPTREDVLRVLDYDASTGTLSWKVSNKVAGTLSTHRGRRYRRIKIKKRIYMVHQLIWLLETGQWPDRDVDHIDGDGTNNRISNLRLASRRENMGNQVRHRDNNSGCKGVSWHKGAGKWQAGIGHNNRRIHLGLFDNLNDARRAYAEAANRYFGAFARCV